MFTLRDFLDTGVCIQGDIAVKIFDKDGNMVANHKVEDTEMLFDYHVSQRALNTEVRFIYHDKENDMLTIEVCEED